MTSEKAKRRWQRYDVKIPVKISIGVDGKPLTFSGEASNVSIGGMALFTTRHLEPGTSLVMVLILPYSSEELKLRGVVRNRNGFTHGIEFTHSTPLQERLIELNCRAFALLE